MSATASILPAEAIQHAWEAEGAVIFRGLLRMDEVARLRQICDPIIELFYAEHGGRAKLGRGISIQYLTEPRYHKERRRDLLRLLEFIAEPRVLHVMRALGEGAVLFHNTQYFVEQATENWDGIWHRDSQFEAPDPTEERARIRRSTGVHFKFALEKDDWFEYVPGSHRRWDTDAELAVRRSPDPSGRNHPDMPGRVRAILAPGDAIVSHSFMIHRARYRTEPIRRTLDIVYHLGKACEYIRPPATCFDDPTLPSELSAQAQKFFEPFIAAHKGRWGSPRFNHLPPRPPAPPMLRCRPVPWMCRCRMPGYWQWPGYR
jgi:phytanoyl-CoA dioxygenase PhyH